jgi:hypothetical protein
VVRRAQKGFAESYDTFHKKRFRNEPFHQKNLQKGEPLMKKVLLGTILLAVVIIVPIPTMAGVDIEVPGVGIHIGGGGRIALPPPIRFYGPPDVVVMPDTDDVYFVPDIDADMFFWNGWWWRPYEGRWYRSHYYDRGWAYYNDVPSFYFDVDPGWRGYSRDHNWYGHRWNYDRIPYQQLHQNWGSWHNNRYWERERTWGVQGYQPRQQQQRQELRHQRQEQYHQQYQQGHEGQRDQQQKLDQQKQGQQHQGEKSQHQQSQEKPEGENAGQIK